jgi:predicted acylesterase/phospholipase RssA
MSQCNSTKSTPIIKNLVFSGGGMKGISYIGVMRALEEFGILKDIECFSGASVGGIFAALCSLGYRYSELYDFVKNFEYDLVSDIQLLGILSNYGLETGIKIERFIQILIKRKTGKMELTFKEHKEKTGKNLVINATCLTTGKVEHFSSENTPDMPLYIALRMTISLPVLISPVKWNGKLYADGGMLENFPLKLFPPEHTLGIRFSRTPILTGEISSFEEYLVRTLSCVYMEMNRLKDEKITGYTQIVIKLPFSTFQFNLTKKNRKKMYKEGYFETKKRLFELGYNLSENICGLGLVKSIVTEIDSSKIENDRTDTRSTTSNKKSSPIANTTRKREHRTRTIITSSTDKKQEKNT